MADVYSYKTTKNPPDQYRLSTVPDDDRYTPIPPYDNSSERPYQRDTNTPGKYDNSIRSYENTPELYHLKTPDHDNHIDDRHRSPPVNTNKTRMSPKPYDNSNGFEPKMYHIQVPDENRPQPSAMTDETYPERRSDSPMKYITDDADRIPGKVIVYVLTTAEEENMPPPVRSQRTPSSPIRPMKTQQPKGYDTNNNYNRYDQAPYSAEVHNVNTHMRHIPTTHSRASQSIQRSMDKYRFGGS